jgi:alpha-beta hydrolase superfamily lysophospholipase
MIRGKPCVVQECSATVKHEQDTFHTRDRLELFRQSWLPDREIRATVAIVHGFTEHSGRHRWHAEQLATRGYAVEAFDLRGHGRSCGPRAYVDRFDRYVDDLEDFFRLVHPQQAGPTFVYGHSMGGQIAALWAIDRQPDLAGVALSAPPIRVGDNVFPLLRRLSGFAGKWLPWLRLVRLGSGYLSRDPAVVESFRRDPLVFHGRFPARTGAEILRSGPEILARADHLTQPLLLLQGTADRIVDPNGADELFSRAGSTDKTLKQYEGLYHEVLSEPEREEVLADLATWLDARLS